MTLEGFIEQAHLDFQFLFCGLPSIVEINHVVWLNVRVIGKKVMQAGFALSLTVF